MDYVTISSRFRCSVCLSYSKLIDTSLGLRPSSGKGYLFSEMLCNVNSIYLCGGDQIEDITTYLGRNLKLRPNARVASSDTISRALKSLACENTEYTSDAAFGGDYVSRIPLLKWLCKRWTHSVCKLRLYQLSPSIKGNPSPVCQLHLDSFRENFRLWLRHENSPEKECSVKRPEGLLNDYRDKLRPT